MLKEKYSKSARYPRGKSPLRVNEQQPREKTRRLIEKVKRVPQQLTQQVGVELREI